MSPRTHRWLRSLLPTTVVGAGFLLLFIFLRLVNESNAGLSGATAPRSAVLSLLWTLLIAAFVITLLILAIRQTKREFFFEDLTECLEIFLAAPFPLVLLDMAGNLRRANPVAYAILPAGAEPGANLAEKEPFRSVLALCEEDGAGAGRDALFTNVRTGSVFRLSAEVIRRDQHPAAILVSFHDISNERRLELAKREFVTLVSHQLRTPLSGLKWLVEFVMEGQAGRVSRKQHEYLGQVRTAVERMVGFVNELIVIAQVESGGLRLRAVPVDLGVLAKHVLREFEEDVGNRGLTIRTSFPDDCPSVELDPSLTHQVIENLLRNSIEYTLPGGTVSVEVTCDGAAVQVRIGDTGVGIPKRDQARVFQKFFRGDNVMRTETEGGGLGLYITKAIVEASGGTIWFTSEELHGSSFFVSYPIRSVVSDQESGTATIHR